MGRHPNAKWQTPSNANGSIDPRYQQWIHMRSRCKIDGYVQRKYKTYEGCSLAPEWESFDVWLEWASQQIGFLSVGENGWYHECDKDILTKGNKLYSPETCVFVPKEVNSFYLKSDRSRGSTPIGVTYNKKNRSFVSQIRQNKVNTYLGSYKTAIEAYNAYVERKTHIARELALKYTGLVDPRVIDALNNFNVSIDD